MIEALAIRILHVLHALRPRRTPGLCPPACSESHTYRYPCRGRARREGSSGSTAVRGGADMLVDPPTEGVTEPTPMPLNMAPTPPTPEP